MERSLGLQSCLSQSSKAVINDKSNKDVSVSGRQYVRSNSKRKSNNENSKILSQNTSCGKHSSNSRSRPRGSGSVSVSNEMAYQTIANQSLDDLNDKKSYGSKKHNMNHLLNFTFGSRDEAFSEQRYGRNGGRGGLHRSHRYNKEHYLQANCQFIVKDSNDYSIHCSDPDKSVDWDSVEEIRFNRLTAETVCPICLDSPIAAKITRCGHIYCWSCVLHYLALSDKKWRKCPICFDAMHKQDLRSVSSVAKVDYKVADYMTLTLMKRKKGSTIAIPVALFDMTTNFSNDRFEPLNGNPVKSSYQKILTASPNQVLTNIIERERAQLNAQKMEDQDSPEVCFIDSALEQLKDRELLLLKKTTVEDMKSDSHLKSASDERPVEGAVAEEYYYFYQSEDGQHIYLHSLNVRMLKHQFGSLAQSPIDIKGKIVEMEWESMSDEVRKRLRYLQHLPLTCEFRIVELQLNDQLISDATIDAFRTEVVRRQKNRSKRAREERRRDRHIQVEENKRIHGIYPLPKYQLDNYQQFPTCFDMNDICGPNSPINTSESSTVEDFPNNDMNANNYGASPPSAAEPEFQSFASMLREGKSRHGITVETDKKMTKYKSLDKESDEEYQPPVYNYSLCDAFEAALELKTSSGNQNDNNESKRVSSKKKKNKPKILMSTAMKRSY